MYEDAEIFATALRQMRKSWNATGDDYATRIERLRARGIMTYGTFVFGYDGDTEAKAKQIVEFLGGQGRTDEYPGNPARVVWTP